MDAARTGIGASLAGLLLGALVTSGALASSVDPPLPPPRPDRRETPPAEPAPPETKAAPPEAAENGGCPDRLARLGVRFEERPPVHEDACSVEDAVLVSALPDGVEVKPPSLMRCPVAVALARWTLETVAPEADRRLEAAVTAIAIGTSYQCRNQRSGSKLSEHAFGNGVDVMGFEFAKRGPVHVVDPEGSPEGAFRIAIQRGACPIFTTVLGPGSDEAHANHLHLDLRARRGGYRICQ
jgi:hypothetical protein